jgi:hypothetical protein
MSKTMNTFSPEVRERRTDIPTEMAKALERCNRELCQANEILRKASAYFAMAELDRRSSSTRTGMRTGSSRSARFCDRLVHLP